MPAVQVRDFSQETYDLIKQEAQRSGRSITQQTKHIVLEHFSGKAAAANVVQHTAPGATAAPRADARPWPLTAPPAWPEPAGVAPQAATPFWGEPEQSSAAREERRAALLQRMASRTYPPEALELDSAALVREMRDGR